MNRLAVVALVAALVLTSCSTSPDEKSKPPTSPGVSVSAGGVHVSADPGAVPEGSDLAVRRDSTPNPLAHSGVSGLRPLGQAAQITIDGGKTQPRSPLIVAVRVSSPPLGTSTRVGFVLEGDRDSDEFVLGKYDAATSSVIAEVPHLSHVWPVQIDVAKLLRDAMDYVLESTGLTSARPGCAGREPIVAGRKYTVVQPAQAWLCLKSAGSALSVDVQANSPVPFLIKPRPRATSSSTITDLGNQSTVGTALVRGLGFLPDGAGLIGPGVNTRFRYTAPGPAKLNFRAEPSLLLVQLLIGVLEPVLDAKGIETLSKAKCFHDVVGAAQNPSFTVKAAADVTVAFLSCVGEIVKLSPAGAVVLAMIAAVPQAFAASSIGIVEEFTGEATFTASIEAGVAAAGSPAGALRVGQTAHFAYFDVTVDDHRMLPGLWGAHVRVCYTHRHPSANPDGSTRVSTDPWQFGSGAGARAQYSKDPTIDTQVSDYWKPAYGEATLKVGQCHTGWLSVSLVEGVVGFSGMRYAPSNFPFSATWRW